MSKELISTYDLHPLLRSIAPHISVQIKWWPDYSATFDDLRDIEEVTESDRKLVSFHNLQVTCSAVVSGVLVEGDEGYEGCWCRGHEPELTIPDGCGQLIPLIADALEPIVLASARNPRIAAECHAILNLLTEVVFHQPE